MIMMPYMMPRCSSQQHSGSTASAKQYSQDRSPSSKTISCPAITAWAALVAHSTQTRVQGGCVDLQEPQQRHSTDIPQSSGQGSRQWTDTSLVCRPTTGQAVRQDRLRETILSLFCANCLELVAWDTNQRWLTVHMYLNLGLRRTFSVKLLINTRDWPAASAYEANAFRRFINRIIIIIIILLVHGSLR